MTVLNSPTQAEKSIPNRILFQNPGVLKFYLNLLEMESRYPKAYPRGTAMRYLQVAGSLGDSSSSPRLPGTLDEQILDCFDRSTVLTSGQLNARVSSSYGSCSRRWFSKCLSKLLAAGKLQRQGQQNSYSYFKVMVKEEAN